MNRKHLQSRLRCRYRGRSGAAQAQAQSRSSTAARPSTSGSGLHRRRRLRPLCPRARPAHGPCTSRQSCRGGQNMPGAGSLKATQYVYGVAPGRHRARDREPRHGDEPLINDAKFDATSSLGSADHQRDQRMCNLARVAGQDLGRYVQARVLRSAARDRRRSRTFALILRNRVRRQGQLVTGYPGGNDINLPMERGEVDGRCGLSWSEPENRSNGCRRSAAGAVRVGEERPISRRCRLRSSARRTTRAQVLRLLVAGSSSPGRSLAPPDVRRDRKEALRPPSTRP